MKRFNPLRLLALAITIAVCTFITLIFAFGRDEGTMSNKGLPNFLADSYQIFRFPTHWLFWHHMQGSMFFIGLIVNVILYSLIVETVIAVFIRRRSSPQ